MIYIVNYYSICQLLKYFLRLCEEKVINYFVTNSQLCFSLIISIKVSFTITWWMKYNFIKRNRTCKNSLYCNIFSIEKEISYIPSLWNLCFLSGQTSMFLDIIEINFKINLIAANWKYRANINTIKQSKWNSLSYWTYYFGIFLEMSFKNWVYYWLPKLNIN